MKYYPAKYRAANSLDQASCFHTREVGDSGDNLSSATGEHIPTEIQTRWTYFLLGCATLLPWNVLIIGSSFFLTRIDGSPFYPTFRSCLSSVYTLTKLVFLFYCTTTLKQSSTSRRIFASMIAIIILMTSIWLSTFIYCPPSVFLAFFLLSAASFAVTSGYLCTGVFAEVALLGSRVLQTMLWGQGALGVVISAVQVAGSMIALGSLPPKSLSARVDGRDDKAEEIAARIFFGVSAVFLCITLIAYTWLTRQSLPRLFIRALEQPHRVGDVDERTGLLADDCTDLSKSRAPISHVYQVLRKNLIFMFSIAYICTVDLAICPTVTARVQPVNPGTHYLLFTALHFLAYNIGDLAGRYSCSFPYFRVYSGKKILAMSLCQTLFIPLILLCNVERPATDPIPPIINSDILFMVIMVAIGYMTGFVVSLALLAVSSIEHNHKLMGHHEDVDIAATLGNLFVILGLALGSLASFGVQAII